MSVNRRAPFLIAAAGVLLSAHVFADASVREMRHHSEVVSRTGSVYYTVTEVLRLGESEDRTLYLVEDGKGNRYEVSLTMSYWKQENVKEIRDVRRKTFIRLTYRYPSKAKTRSETIAEAKRTTDAKPYDPLVIVETESTAKEALESEWNDVENARVWRADLRSMSDRELLEALEGMRGTLFAHLKFQLVCRQLVGRFLYGDSCAKSPIGTMRVAPPDCFYDGRFGFPCSPSQKVRVTTAAKEQRVLEQY